MTSPNPQKFPESRQPAPSSRNTVVSALRSLWLCITVLLAVWCVVIVFVNPVGEFSINDDWSFVRSLEALRDEGKMIPTGWGPGGPALITHLLWALTFTTFTGFSLTALRVSVLVLGVVGSLILLLLLRLSGSSRWLALCGSLTLVLNPLFLSQSFTFMTDVTFTAWCLFSLLFLHLGTEKRSTLFVAVGFVFALCAILSRQIGIVLPLGFCAACILHPAGRQLGRVKVVVLALVVIVIPWLSYEVFLSSVGSTAVTDHDVLDKIFRYPRKYGVIGFALLCVDRLYTALVYTCILISPVLVPAFRDQFQNPGVRKLFLLWTGLFVAFEFALVAGILDPPTAFHWNVIYDFGIGPVILKDTYILKIQRTLSLPKPLYYLLIYWAVPAIVLTVALAASSVRDVLAGFGKTRNARISFLGSFSLLSALAYVGIILLTGFHDRYLIPVCMFLIVWIISRTPQQEGFSLSFKGSVPSLILLVIIGIFSVGGVRDFMEMKRSLAKANQYVLTDLGKAPCQYDGGFEFNGYHCYKKDFESPEGLSWWWVEREDYLLTLGPLPGYETVGTFPFQRYLGPDGAVHVLKPQEGKPDRGDSR